MDDKTLSDKIETNYEIENEKNYDFILVKDVKNWVKTLKKDLDRVIDKRLGDKLI